MWFGGSIVAISTILLRSHITLFQSLSCIFPILLASMINYFFILNLLLKYYCFYCICLEMFCSVSFISDVLGKEKKGLGLFPIVLFYFAFTCYFLL